MIAEDSEVVKLSNPRNVKTPNLRVVFARVRCIVLAAGLPVLAVSSPVAAHGTGSRTDLPLPAWQMAWAAAFSVIVSFVALGTYWEKPRLSAAAHGRRFLKIDSPLSKAISVLLRFIGLGLFAVVMAAAWWGNTAPLANFAPTAFLIWFWVGVQLLSVLFGDIYRAFNPYVTIADACAWLKSKWAKVPLTEEAFGANRFSPWVTVATISAYLWYELAYHSTDSPRALAIFLTVYSFVMLGGAVLFGRAWVRGADGFAVLFQKISMLAPVYRGNDRFLRVRPPLSGISTLQVNTYGSALILIVLGATTFDGFTRSSFWLDVAAEYNGWAATFVNTAGIIVIVALVGLLYLLAMRAMTALCGDPMKELANTFAPTLIPIVVAYAIAHYFSAVLLDGQVIINLLSDPFGRGWNIFGTRNYEINWTLVTPRQIAWVQAGSIALGHVLAVAAAHDLAIERYPRATALRSQYPLLTVMVAYTVIGLLLLLGT